MPRGSSVTASRRGFLGGLIGIIAAPAIVRAASLMPVRAPKLIDAGHEFVFRTSIPAGAWRQYNVGVPYDKLFDDVFLRSPPSHEEELFIFGDMSVELRGLVND